MSYETNQYDGENELVPFFAYVPEDTAWLIQNILRAVQNAHPYADPSAPTKILGEIIARGVQAQMDSDQQFQRHFLQKIGEPFAIDSFIAPEGILGDNIVPLSSYRERLVVLEEENDQD